MTAVQHHWMLMASIGLVSRWSLSLSLSLPLSLPLSLSFSLSFSPPGHCATMHMGSKAGLIHISHPISQKQRKCFCLPISLSLSLHLGTVPLCIWEARLV